MIKSILVSIVLAIAVPAAAQSIDQRAASATAWRGHEVAADRISTGIVAGSLAWLAFETWRHSEARSFCGDAVFKGRNPTHCRTVRSRKTAFVRTGLAVGITVGVAEATKRLVDRERPDGSDHLSFFSEHTALASIALGKFPGTKLPVIFTVSTGAGRMSARKHYMSDVLVGTAAGFAAGRLFR